MISTILKYGYLEYLKYTYPNHENRLEDISQLINFSTEYDSLVNFLSELSLMSGISGEEVIEGGKEDEKLVLSTIHQAKGWNGGPSPYLVCRGQIP
jgi:DNA helicase-2/ATP-dependent DNA helicase PcrA